MHLALTADHAALARRLLDLHGPHEDILPLGACRWCLKTWPCPDGRWSYHALTQWNAAQRPDR